jgi:hypothetical protein
LLALAHDSGQCTDFADRELRPSRASRSARAALGLDAWFVWQIVRVLRERSDAAARRAFHVSLAYLFALFLAMLVDRVL